MASFQTKDCSQCLAWTYFATIKSFSVLSAEPASSFLFYDKLSIMMMFNDILQDLLGSHLPPLNSADNQSSNMASHGLGYTFTSAFPAAFCVSPLPCVGSTTTNSSTGVAMRGVWESGTGQLLGKFLWSQNRGSNPAFWALSAAPIIVFTLNFLFCGLLSSICLLCAMCQSL